MHRFGPEVQNSLLRAQKHGAKVSVFDDRGCLLWFCNNWEDSVGSMGEWSEAMGRGWLEFVHPDDLKKCQEWIAADDGATVNFRSVHPTQRGRWQYVVLIKRRVGLYWVAIGEHSEAPRITPAPNTEMLFSLALLITGMVDKFPDLK